MSQTTHVKSEGKIIVFFIRVTDILSNIFLVLDEVCETTFSLLNKNKCSNIFREDNNKTFAEIE